MDIKQTYGIVQHNIRVSKLAERIAYAMGLEDEECQSIAISGFFIDLGKISMNESVFNSTRNLTDEEYEYVKEHTTRGTQMLMESNNISEEVVMSIIHHHENYDGSGYPSGLIGEQIPLGARILKLCDVFYALMEKRPFREDYSKKDAMQILEKENHHFDPKIMSIFKEVIGASKVYM